MKRWIGIAFVLGILVGGLGVMRSQQAATATQRIMQFENDDVKVWKSVVVPNAPLSMHRHEHGRVIIALRGGTMKIVEQNGTSEAPTAALTCQSTLERRASLGSRSRR